MPLRLAFLAAAGAPLPSLLAFLAAAGGSPVTAPAASAATLAADPPVLLGQGEGRMTPSSGFYSFGASGAVVGQANNTMVLSTDGKGARWQPADLPDPREPHVDGVRVISRVFDVRIRLEIKLLSVFKMGNPETENL